MDTVRGCFSTAPSIYISTLLHSICRGPVATTTVILEFLWSTPLYRGILEDVSLAIIDQGGQ